MAEESARDANADDVQPDASAKKRAKKQDVKTNAAAEAVPAQEILDELCRLTAELEASKSEAAAQNARADEMTAAAQRFQADFDNYRRRNAEAVMRARKDGQCDVVEGIFPALDVFENALAMITDDSVAQGIRMVQRKFTETLQTFGVEQLPALGEDFDPELHDAIERVEVTDEKQSGKVVVVLQQGYRMGDKILRHSLVKVGK